MVILLLTGTSLYGGGEGYCNRANAPVGVSRDAPATQSLPGGWSGSWRIRSGPKWQWPAHEGAIVQVGIRHTDWRWPCHTVLASGPDLDEDRRIRDVDSGSLPGFRYLNHESLQQEIAVDERYDVPFEVQVLRASPGVAPSTPPTSLSLIDKRRGGGTPTKPAQSSHAPELHDEPGISLQSDQKSSSSVDCAPCP